MGCVRETPQIKKQKSQHGMCKRNSPHQKKVSMGYVTETPTLKKEANMGCVRETAHIKTKSAWDV